MRLSALRICTVIMLMLAMLFVGTASFASDDMQETDRDEYCYGLIAYAQRDQIIRNLTKKSVAYVTQILDSAERVVDPGNVKAGNHYRYSLVEGINTFNPEAVKSHAYLAGITFDFFSETEYDYALQEISAEGSTTPYYVVSAEELMNADVIVTTGCIPMQAMIDSLGDVDYQGIIISEVPAAFQDEEAADEKALTWGFYIGSAFSETMNPVDVCAYYYEHFLGYEDRAALKEKVDSVFSSIDFYKGYANTLGEEYDPDAVESMIENGAWFYLDNIDMFRGGAFDENGMSSWEPDAEPETESESETETETETEPETETETETESESETEPEATAPEETEAKETATAGTVTETAALEEIPTYELPSWIGAAFGAPIVAAGLIIYIIYAKKKD